MFWLFLVLEVSWCYLKTAYRTVQEVDCDEDLVTFKSNAETFILPSCLHSNEHWISHIRAQTPTAQIFVESTPENPGLFASLEKIDGLLIKEHALNDIAMLRATIPETMRLMVDIGYDAPHIHDGILRVHDIILFRSHELLRNDGLMKNFAVSFLRSGVMWAVLNQNIPQEDVEMYCAAFWQWAQYGGLGIDSRWLTSDMKQGIEIERITEIPEILEELIGWLPKEIIVFDTYPYRISNEFGQPECLPGRLSQYFRPPMFVEVNPRPEWPHRIAYHGFSKEETLSAIRESGWRLRPCTERCHHGNGIYASPSFMIAMKHYSSGLQKTMRFFRICLQVAIRNEIIHYGTMGDRLDDAQWQDFNFPDHPPGIAPEFRIENPDDVVVTGIIISEFHFSPFMNSNTLDLQI